MYIINTIIKILNICEKCCNLYWLVSSKLIWMLTQNIISIINDAGIESMKNAKRKI